MGVVEAFIKRIGFYGVDIFIFLSGIGLTFSFRGAGVLRFYYKRLKRIALPILITAFAYAIVQNWTGTEFLRKVSGYDFYTVSIHSFLWYLPALMTLYLFFPWYYKLFLNASRPAVFFALSLGTWFVFSYFLRNIMRGDLYGFTNRIPIFLIGIYIGWVMQQRKVRFTIVTWIVIAAIFGCGLYLADLTIYKEVAFLLPYTSCCLPAILIAVSLSFLIALVLELLKRFTKCFGQMVIRLLELFGSVSLELYCIQELFGWNFISYFLGKHFSCLQTNLLVLGCLVLISYGIHGLSQDIWKTFEAFGGELHSYMVLDHGRGNNGK